MTFRNQLLIVLLAFPVFFTNGQDGFLFTSDVVYKLGFEPVNRKLDYKNIDGSPYLVDNLIEGGVHFTKGKVIKNYLRYNAYADEMEYLEGSKLMVITNPNQIEVIYLGNFEFHFLYYTLASTEVRTGYLVKVVDGPCKLYKKINVAFVDAVPARSSYDPPKPATFLKKADTWFLSFENQPPTQVLLDKNVIDHFFGQDDRVKQYAKEQKLKAKKPEDLAEIVRYFNSLNGQSH